MASKAGLRVAHEVFADRAYNPDGSLVSRGQKDAIILRPEEVVQRAVMMVTEGTVQASNGKVLRLGTVHTMCVHGDTPNAVKLAKALRKGLTKAGIKVERAGNFI
jgi:UPF0271 protein